LFLSLPSFITTTPPPPPPSHRRTLGFSWLLSTRGSVVMADEESVWTAAAHGDVDALRAAHQNGTNLNEGDYDYRYGDRSIGLTTKATTTLMG
jgi:hypothetical protein